MSSWSLATATAVAHQLALENGDAPARLLRFGSNGLFVVGPHTVARISPSSRNVARGVQFALAAAEAGLPVLTPLGGQVYERDGLLVTLWPYHPKADGPVDYRWLGEVVARLHRLAPRLADACDLDLARNELPQTQLAKVGQRLETLRDHAAYGPTIDVLSVRYQRLSKQWAELPWSSLVVLHGDLYGGNVLVTNDQCLLIDFDRVVVGPQAWDQVPVDVQVRRFGLPSRCRREFLSGYGTSLATDPGYDLLIQLREMASITWAAKLALLRPELQEEVWLRLRTLDTLAGTVTWTPR